MIMKNRCRRFISWMLVLVMVLCLMPTTVFADTAPVVTTTHFECSGQSELAVLENVGDQASFTFTAPTAGTYIMNCQVNSGTKNFEIATVASASNPILKTEFRNPPAKLTGYVLEMEEDDAYTLILTRTSNEDSQVTVGVGEPTEGEYFNGFWGYYFAPGTKKHYQYIDEIEEITAYLDDEALKLAFFVKDGYSYNESIAWTASSSNASVISVKNKTFVIEPKSPDSTEDYAEYIGYAPIFKLNSAGTADIAISATYDGNTIEQKFAVTVKEGGQNLETFLQFEDFDELESLLEECEDTGEDATLRYSGSSFVMTKGLEVPENVEISFGDKCKLEIAKGAKLVVKGNVFCGALNILGELNIAEGGQVNPSNITTIKGALTNEGEFLCETPIRINGNVLNEGDIYILKKATQSSSMSSSVISVGPGGAFTSTKKASLMVETEPSIEDIKSFVLLKNLDEYDITNEAFDDDVKLWTLRYVGRLPAHETPTDLQWGIEYSRDEKSGNIVEKEKPGAMSWTTNLSGPSSVLVKLYNAENETEIYSWTTNFHSIDQSRYHTDDWFMINDDQIQTGSYYFTVQLLGDGINYRNSDEAKSDVYQYTKPDDQLDACTSPTWEDRNVDYVYWMKWKANSSNKYKDGYQVRYLYSETKDGEFKPFNSAWARNIKKTERPLGGRELQQKGTGYYKFQVRMLSRDIEKYCNGPWSEESPVLDLREMPADISNDLRKVLNSTGNQSMTVDNIRKEVQQMDTKKLRATLLTDMENSGATAVLESIEKKVGGPAKVEVRDGASAFDIDEISVVGANLNLKQNSSSEPITLILDEPDAIHDIPEDFNSAVSVKFSMTLTDVKSPKQLEVPVKITLPVPENFNPELLVIIHYHHDGSWTQEWPYVYEKDGKIYADFVLTSFSDFTLAQEGVSDGTGTDNPSGSDDDHVTVQPDYDDDGDDYLQEKALKEEALPGYVEKGSWTSVGGKWTFADSTGEKFKNRWAAVQNPYADEKKGQDPFDWFFFDENGHMITGWFFENGRWYYLNPVSDGTQGRMFTGWQLIDGKWYYLNPISDGTKGAMIADAWIDNYYVDANGVWDETKTK